MTNLQELNSARPGNIKYSDCDDEIFMPCAAFRVLALMVGELVLMIRDLIKPWLTP